MHREFFIDFALHTPTVEYVRSVATSILRHRVIPNHRAVGDGVTSMALVEHVLKVTA
jgi:MoxR-like ATPase